MDAKITGRVRGKSTGNYAEGQADQQFEMNNRGDMCVVQALPERTELVRMGSSYFSVGTGVAPVTAIPSTGAHFSLWNGEADGGKSYIIDAVGTVITTSAGAAINLGICGQLNLGKVTNPAGAVAIKSLSGKLNYGGLGNCKASVTVTNDSAWLPLGNTVVCANTANLMLNVHYELYGRIIIPPGGLFSLVSLCNAAGSAVCTPYMIWHEVQLVLG